MDEIEIINDVIGKRYELGSMGPDTFDCWGLVRYIQLNVFQRELKVLETKELTNIKDLIKFIKDHPEHKNWTAVDIPEHGSVVEMANLIHPNHVGVYLDIDGGGVLHCGMNGVMFDTVFNLKASGWRKFKFYRYNHDS
jgi:hypothetical protein